ncbi:hypothetical protein VQ056_12610 [Paenibacillus sp. JTLBN-2024]
MLAYRYYTHRKLYERLESPLQSMDQSLTRLGEAPVAEAVSDMLRHQFQLYKDELYGTQQRLDNHTAFINRWIHQMKTPVSVIQLTLQDLDLDDEIADGLQEEIDRLKKGLEMALYTAGWTSSSRTSRWRACRLRKRSKKPSPKTGSGLSGKRFTRRSKSRLALP